MKSRILIALAVAAVATTIFCLSPRKSCASGTCGECSTSADTDGWYVTDPDGSQRCAQCDGRVD